MKIGIDLGGTKIEGIAISENGEDKALPPEIHVEEVEQEEEMEKEDFEICEKYYGKYKLLEQMFNAHALCQDNHLINIYPSY